MTTLGVIVGNRGFFPSHLADEGRKTILKVLEEEGFGAICLTPEETPYGSVETYEQAQKCAELFKAHRAEIDGILVTLPNFGEERGIADAIRLAGLNVPVLVQATPDTAGKMTIADRRDSFCGKMSVCNNLTQYGIDYSLTRLHTVDPESDAFRQDLAWFGSVCRVVNGLRKARLGQIGARPAAFITVRYSEKLLENTGISVETLDLSEVFGRAWKLADNDPQVKAKLDEIQGYVATQGIPTDALAKMAKFALVIEDWIAEHELNGIAVQCWTAMEEFYGVVPCTAMSMLSNKLLPSACEADISGLVGMYAMVLASGRPSALLDWNNNYGDDPNKGVIFHCSNLPQVFFGGEARMDYQEIIAGTVGRENTYGTLVGPLKPTDVTYCRVSTNDQEGWIRSYLGEGRITDDRVETFGGYGVIEIPNFQLLLHHICANGFEHHVAMNPSRCADALEEAFSRYLGWEVYHHRG
ncbi:MAG: fucose isomerase [Chloroflexi bacterium]|nr:fucose isomerase [Chloroflexota bacterium]